MNKKKRERKKITEGKHEKIEIIFYTPRGGIQFSNSEN